MLSGFDVDFNDIAIGVVVRRVPGCIACRVVGQRRDLVEHLAFDFGELTNFAVCKSQFAKVANDARIAEASNDALCFWIVVGARDRSQCAVGESLNWSDWEFVYRLEIGTLEFSFPGDPFSPNGIEWLAIDLFEGG